jgi:hypothetical protein
MRLISFNFDKICIEKNPKKIDKIDLKTNIEFIDIKEAKSDFKFKEELLNIKFKYDIDYGSEFAKLNFVGNVLVSLEAKDSKKLLKEFKDKKISDEFKIPLFNLILKKSNVKALELEDELSIPLHIKLPYIKEK